MNHLQQVIDNAWESRDRWDSHTVSAEIREAIEHTIDLLDDGGVRVSEQDSSGEWITQEWLKKAVLLYFKQHGNQLINGGTSNYYDKVPLKFTTWGENMFHKAGIRVVPPATVRKGAYIAPKVVLMPSYVNIGAY
ncbi:MAG: 2,3,4,5-tetrahydropyridine-2,6-dicarboxylate N-succinyltransferase, partial [Mariprofundales bacterium]|nr:2,3,4,5-tetrahydropyridine-2,6-dicarboxylate N-succinyltransferase [Mariprofundales bacterium]